METWSQLLSTLDGELRRAMEFLYTHLPQSDLDTYPAALFLQFADHAPDHAPDAALVCGAAGGAV